MRAAVKKDIHSGYQGIEGCMNKELKAWLRTCETCRENELAPYKEKLMSREIPEGAWEKIHLSRQRIPRHRLLQVQLL